ncbi:MAG: hypothetical protein EP329_09605 [Deltaproteobacteria bacterium]|nr:MAG: hypothetical protein EP329_09605 [Deltaproteobacteria bacterium]
MKRFAVWILVGTAHLACADTPTAPDAGARLAIEVAPLALPGVGNAEYTLTVVNLAGETVWTRQIDSDGYGDGAGSISYVGSCDADSSPNAVRLTLDALYDTSAALIDPATYANPTASGPLSRTVACVADADTPVTFDLTIARAAQQGFFDVAVSFDDLFCSAKLDCGDTTAPEDDLLLLHDAGGARATTVVVGFACTGGPTRDTWLYLDNLRIDCVGGVGAPTLVDVSQLGNVADLDAAPGANPDGYLFAAAVYRGNEQLANKSYWNVALGLDRTRFAALGACTLSGQGTAASASLDAMTTPDSSAYPFIAWNAVLSDGAGRVCTRHAVDQGDEVATRYASAPAVQFQHEYARATGLLTSCGVEICASGLDEDCDGLVDEPVVADDFDGTALAAIWTTDPVGGLPTYTVAGSTLTVTDAPYATTPSSPTQSWIYDLNQDQGNQLTWPQAIGTGDFDLTADLGWSSSIAELTLGGVALTNAAGLIEVLVGFSDGGSTAYGSPVVRVRSPTNAYGGTAAVSGSASFRVTRSGGDLSVTMNGVEVLAIPGYGADIAHVAIVNVPHRSGASTYPFGTMTYDVVNVCY